MMLLVGLLPQAFSRCEAVAELVVIDLSLNCDSLSGLMNVFVLYLLLLYSENSLSLSP